MNTIFNYFQNGLAYQNCTNSAEPAHAKHSLSMC